MQQIQLTKEQETELLSMTRLITDAEHTALNQAYAQLDKKGFVFSGENFMRLIRVYNEAPQAPITVKGILDYTKTYRDAFQWLSAEEVEYNTLSAQIGPDKTALVTKELGRHGLINTAGTQELFGNFSAVVRFYQTKRWTISSDSFEKAIGNLRNSLGHWTLHYKPTPEEIARQKRWEDTRKSEPNTEYKNFKKTTKSALQLAQEKAAAAAHVVLPDGRRMSDVIMAEFYEQHGEELETETPAQKTPPAITPDEAFWKKQTLDYIQSLSGQNLLQQEAQQSFGQALHGSWRTSYANLRNWHDRKKLGVWGQS